MKENDTIVVGRMDYGRCYGRRVYVNLPLSYSFMDRFNTCDSISRVMGKRDVYRMKYRSALIVEEVMGRG